MTGGFDEGGVLAAGKGTRHFPLTGEIPKPLAPVVVTPIIGNTSTSSLRHGVAQSYVNVHYLADTVLEAYGEEIPRGRHEGAPHKGGRARRHGRGRRYRASTRYAECRAELDMNPAYRQPLAAGRGRIYRERRRS